MYDLYRLIRDKDAYIDNTSTSNSNLVNVRMFT